MFFSALNYPLKQFSRSAHVETSFLKIVQPYLIRVDLPWQDLKRHLLEIRAGIHDEKILKPCKAHSDEQIIERYKFLGFSGM